VQVAQLKVSLLKVTKKREARKMFIGRKRELCDLEEIYSKDSGTLTILYGRRRVGKTRLIQEFTKGKKTIFFSAQEGDRESNLVELSRAIVGQDKKHFPVFSSFKEALEYIGEEAEKEKTVFFIDEYPYLVDSLGSEISSVLQNFIDIAIEKSKLMIILCGSSVSFMENEVISSKNPLYGRARLIMKLKPLNYYETAQWFSSYSPEDKAVLYGATNGIPMYLSYMDPDVSLRENLLRTFFRPNSILLYEQEFVLRQEISEIKSYQAVLSAVANGKTKFNEICDRTKLNPGSVSRILDALKELDIIEKTVPAGEKEESKKGFYSMKDLYFNFWYFFVQRYFTVINQDLMEENYDRLVTPLMNDYMGKVFERIAREYLLSRADLPFPLKDIGSWWGTDNQTRKSIEIDVVAHSAVDDNVIIGSCNFTSKPIDTDEYDLMRAYSKPLVSVRDAVFCFFSKSGFTDNLKKMKNDRIRLISLEEMYR
jgi:uncharacterized protein